jgi:hypothetical protein
MCEEATENGMWPFWGLWPLRLLRDMAARLMKERGQEG